MTKSDLKSVNPFKNFDKKVIQTAIEHFELASNGLKNINGAYAKATKITFIAGSELTTEVLKEFLIDETEWYVVYNIKIGNIERKWYEVIEDCCIPFGSLKRLLNSFQKPAFFSYKGQLPE
jgi:hypothetical protein